MLQKVKSRNLIIIFIQHNTVKPEPAKKVNSGSSQKKLCYATEDHIVV